MFSRLIMLNVANSNLRQLPASNAAGKPNRCGIEQQIHRCCVLLHRYMTFTHIRTFGIACRSTKGKLKPNSCPALFCCGQTASLWYYLGSVSSRTLLKCPGDIQIYAGWANPGISASANASSWGTPRTIIVLSCPYLSWWLADWSGRIQYCLSRLAARRIPAVGLPKNRSSAVDNDANLRRLLAVFIYIYDRCMQLRSGFREVTRSDDGLVQVYTRLGPFIAILTSSFCR